MPITVTEDEGEIGGHALIDLGGLATTPQPRLSIRRQDAEPRHLGPDGWQPEVAWLTPLSAETLGGRTVVRLGPAVVDRIEELVPIEIVEEGGRSFGVVPWPYVTPAPQGSSVTIKQVQDGSTAQPAIAMPKPAEAPTSSDVATMQAEPVPPRPGLPIQFEEPRTAIATASKPTAPVRRPWRALAAVIAVLLVGGAAAGAWAFRDRLPWLPSPEPQPQRPRTELAELERRYASLLQRRAPEPDLLAFGREAIESGQGALAFRSFEEADPAVSEEAAWQLARFYDPRSTTGAAREVATPNAAWSAYYHALWKGRSTRHTDELRALCELNLDGTTRERIQAFCRA